jgi:hypothetical protein
MSMPAASVWYEVYVWVSIIGGFIAVMLYIGYLVLDLWGLRRNNAVDDDQAEGRKGTVALAEARARCTDPLGQMSDDEGQFGECIGDAGGGRYVGTRDRRSPCAGSGRTHGRRR